MKTPSLILSAFALSLILLSCNKESDPEPEAKINHTGEKWNIVSADYTLINQDLSNPTSSSVQNESGVLTNVGAFYFDSGKGSFDITIKQTSKEDYFSYTESGSQVSITSVSQNVGGTAFSQNVIALSGEKSSATSMTLEGSITKQSLTGQFVLSGTFVLQKN